MEKDQDNEVNERRNVISLTIGRDSNEVEEEKESNDTQKVEVRELDNKLDVRNKVNGGERMISRILALEARDER